MSMSLRKCFPVFLSFTLLLSITGAQDYDVSVTTVTVWIKALDKSGKPVTGLTQSDFEIYDEGKAVSPTCFEESVPAAPQSEPESTQSAPAESGTTAPSVSRKTIVFLFDLGNTSQTEFLHLRRKATEFVDQLSGTWNMTLVSLVGPIFEIHAEGTSDAQVILSELETMNANYMRDLNAIKNRRDLAEILHLAATGRQDRQLIERLISEVCGVAREYALQEKRESFQWMDSLKQLDKYLKKQTPENHHAVLLFSGGISTNPGRHYFDTIKDSDIVREFIEDEWDFVREFPECAYEGGTDLQKEFKKLVGKLNRNNVTVYTVNSRGPINDLLETVRESDRKFKSSDLEFLDEYQDFMISMADDTGGLSFENSLNFKKGFDAILSDLNYQYVLCYTPPKPEKEGEHSIKVKVKKPGIKLRHRNGYWV